LIERQIAERDRRVERTPEMKRTELFKLYNDIMGGVNYPVLKGGASCIIAPPLRL